MEPKAPAQEAMKTFYETQEALKARYRSPYVEQYEQYQAVRAEIDTIVLGMVPPVGTVSQRLLEVEHLSAAAESELDLLYEAVLRDNPGRPATEIHDFMEAVFDVSASELAGCMNRLLWRGKVELSSSRVLFLKETATNSHQ